jgi:hypothetical protein
MHPLNKKVFGNTPNNTSIQVHYNSGVGEGPLVGWIVKQTSATFWRIADADTANTAVNDSNTYKCELEGVPPNSLSGNQFTIEAYPLTSGVAANTPVYVARIDGHHVVCSDGNKYIWTLSNTTGPAASYATGYALLATN